MNGTDQVGPATESAGRGAKDSLVERRLRRGGALRLALLVVSCTWASLLTFGSTKAAAIGPAAGSNHTMSSHRPEDPCHTLVVGVDDTLDPTQQQQLRVLVEGHELPAAPSVIDSNRVAVSLAPDPGNMVIFRKLLRRPLLWNTRRGVYVAVADDKRVVARTSAHIDLVEMDPSKWLALVAVVVAMGAALVSILVAIPAELPARAARVVWCIWLVFVPLSSLVLTIVLPGSGDMPPRALLTTLTFVLTGGWALDLEWARAKASRRASERLRERRAFIQAASAALDKARSQVQGGFLKARLEIVSGMLEYEGGSHPGGRRTHLPVAATPATPRGSSAASDSKRDADASETRNEPVHEHGTWMDWVFAAWAVSVGIVVVSRSLEELEFSDVSPAVVLITFALAVLFLTEKFQALRRERLKASAFRHVRFEDWLWKSLERAPEPPKP